MAKIVVFAPNVGLDRIGMLGELEPGAVMRFRSVESSAGGKGLNLARAATALGERVVVVGILGGWIGRLVAGLAQREGLALRPLWIEQETRVNTIVIEASGRVTVFNEPGPDLSLDLADPLLQLLVAELTGSTLVVVTGSLPPGLLPAVYAECVRLAREHDLPIIVDATGEALAAALEAQPDVVTPNVFEAETVLGNVSAERVTARREELEVRALAAARALAGKTRRATVVKAGVAGAAAASAVGLWFASAPQAQVRNPIGAGDAFVAGLAVGLARGWPFEEAVRLAVAAGSASVETLQPGALNPERVEEFRQRVVLQPLKAAGAETMA